MPPIRNGGAAEVADPGLKADYLALASQWTHWRAAMSSWKNLERFLLDSQKAKAALRPTPPETK
jgi:hypothetical protein